MRIRGSNSVYSDTERRILIASANLLKEKHSVNIKIREVSKAAGIACSSFYLHYRSINDLIDVQSKRVLDDVRGLVDKLLTEKSSTEKKLLKLLIFLYKRRELLTLIDTTGNINLLAKIMKEIRPISEKGWLKYSNSITVGLKNMLVAEYIAELRLWSKENYSVNYLEVHAHRLAYFTINTPRFFAAVYKD